MAVTTTAADVRGMFVRVVRAAQALGMNTTDWRLEDGNRANGIAWTLVMPGRSLGVGMGNNFLGHTRTEAYMALQYIARAWEIALLHLADQDRTAEAAARSAAATTSQ